MEVRQADETGSGDSGQLSEDVTSSSPADRISIEHQEYPWSGSQEPKLVLREVRAEQSDGRESKLSEAQDAPGALDQNDSPLGEDLREAMVAVEDGAFRQPYGTARA